jgi:hypothetical protein
MISRHCTDLCLPGRSFDVTVTVPHQQLIDARHPAVTA